MVERDQNDLISMDHPVYICGYSRKLRQLRELGFVFEVGPKPTEDLLNGHDGLPQASTLVPQCNQIITSDAGRNGSFSSPNYPHYYSAKTQCRYVFIGHGRERLQILFTDFSLFHPNQDPATDSSSSSFTSQGHNYLNGNRINDKTGLRKRTCLGADALSVWVYSDGQLEKMLDLCGHTLPPPVMSNGHRLILEFNGASSSSLTRGFYASYAFVEDFGIKSGRQLRDYPCGFVYNSSVDLSGTFTSPNYPGIYPRDTECHYFFYGVDDQHVVLTFNYFHIEGIRPCLESTKSDYVELSNYILVDKKYSRKCGHYSEGFRVISEGHFFRVTFRSNDEYDGGGFSGKFQFTNQINQIMTVNDVRLELEDTAEEELSRSSPDQENPGILQPGSIPSSSSPNSHTYSSHTFNCWSRVLCYPIVYLLLHLISLLT